MKKRIFSLFLAAVMLVGLVPLSVFAEGETGEATWTEPVCASVNGGIAMTLSAAITYVKENGGSGTITLSNATEIDLSGWTAQSISGTTNLIIEGNGATIVGLAQPLFISTAGEGSSLTVQNLTFKNSNVVSVGTTGERGAGVISNFTLYGGYITVSNVKVLGGTFVSDDFAGGLFGYVQLPGTEQKPGLVVENCEITGATFSSSTGGSIGAVAGHVNNGCVSIRSTKVGGNKMSSPEDSAFREDKNGVVIGRLLGSTAFMDVIETEVSKIETTNGYTTLGKIVGSIYKSTSKLSISGGEYLANPTLTTDSNKNSTNEIHLSEAAASQIVVGGELMEKDDKWILAAAKIGDTKYGSLADAVAAANDGDEIAAIVANSEMSGDGIEIKKSVTIDLNASSYEIIGNPVGDIKTNGFRLVDGATVTIKNGTIKSHTGSGVKILVQNYANLTLDKVTLDGTQLDEPSNSADANYTLSNNNGTVNLTDGTVISADTDGTINYAFDVCRFQNYNGANVTVDGATINGDINVWDAPDYAGTASSILTLTNGTLNGKLVVDKLEHATITKATDVSIVAPAGYAWQKGDTTDTLVAAEAEIDQVGYVTLEDAVAAAQENKTITLLDDITVAAPIVVGEGKIVTLDLAGHTISNTTDLFVDRDEGMDDLSLVSVQGGNLTITGNGKLAAKANDCYAADVQGGTLTIKNGTYIGNISAVYVKHGTLNVEGGSYSIQQLGKYNDERYTLNCLDANHQDGSAKIVVTGGSFAKYNPEGSNSEAPTANFLADGYKVTKVGISYHVSKDTATEGDTTTNVTTEVIKDAVTDALKDTTSTETVVVEAPAATTTATVTDLIQAVDGAVTAAGSTTTKEVNLTIPVTTGTNETTTVTFNTAAVQAIADKTEQSTDKTVALKVENVTSTTTTKPEGADTNTVVYDLSVTVGGKTVAFKGDETTGTGKATVTIPNHTGSTNAKLYWRERSSADWQEFAGTPTVTAEQITFETDHFSEWTAVAPNEPVPPAAQLIDNGRSLSLNAEIFINQYVTFSDTSYTQDYITQNGGVLVWTTKPTSANIDDANAKKFEGLTYSAEKEAYWGRTNGIAAKEYADELYICAYLKLDDGTYIYTAVEEYSVQKYCSIVINGEYDQKWKDLCTNMLKYGASAQICLNYKTDDLADAILQSKNEE